MFSGSNDRAIFALSRVFDECNAPYAIVAWKASDPILHSLHRDKVCAVRDGHALSLDSLREWVGAARRIFNDARFVLVPTSEYLNVFLLGIDRSVLESQLNCELPLVDAAAYAELTNKHSATQYFSSVGIPVPRELDSWDASGLPMVAKPNVNVGNDGIVRYPILLHTEAELTSFLTCGDLAGYFPQAFAHGKSVYLLAYLARNGTIFTSSQANLGQQAGGKSIVLARTTTFHHHSIALQAIDALKARGFTGFAMLEFIVGPDGPCFIEMNPRPWGPLQLCADHNCGIVEAFVGDRLHGEPLRHDHVRRRKPPHTGYLWFGGIVKDRRSGRRVRWQGGALRGWLAILGNVANDVYLRRDSWRVFLREIFRR